MFIILSYFFMKILKHPIYGSQSVSALVKSTKHQFFFLQINDSEISKCISEKKELFNLEKLFYIINSSCIIKGCYFK